MQIKNIFLFVLVIFISSCATDTPTSDKYNRPHSPFAFRSVLDKNPRVITLALNDNLWAAYRIENCRLLKAWKGNVNFDGPVYTTHHGPQPTSIGDAYMVNNIVNPWILTDKTGQKVDASIDYKGHKIIDGQAVLMYEMTSPLMEKAIVVEETPEYNKTESDQPIFERKFTTKNVPNGYNVHLSFNTEGIVVKENIKSDGEVVFTKVEDATKGKLSYLIAEGKLTLNSNTTTTFNTTFLQEPTIINPLNRATEEQEAATENLHPGARLIAKNDCKSCHNKNVRTIGPAYVSIAKKYNTNEDNITLLIDKVQNGGTGRWGNQIMNAHPDLSDADLRSMVEYVLSLDKDEEDIAKANIQDKDVMKILPAEVDENTLIPGCVTAVYSWRGLGNTIPKVNPNRKPDQAGIMANFDNISGDDFKDLEDDFVLVANGFLQILKTQNYSFRTWSDDGSILSIGGIIVVNNDGMHGTEYKENKVHLKEGYYPFKLEFMQGMGGKFLSMNWKPADAEKWMVVPRGAIYHKKEMQNIIGDKVLPMANLSKIPGDRAKLNDVHPSFTLTQARSELFSPRVGGIDFLSDGRMVVSTWDAAGSVFIVENHTSTNPALIKHKLIAEGLAEPLGVKVIDDRIFVMQKQEMTELVDTNGDDIIDEYRTLCDDWGVSANFHEFGFGLEGKDGHLYATLATAIEPGGASTNPQILDRGKVLKVNIETGEREFIGHGLRTPNGIGIGFGGDIYVADNQGDWLPSSKIVHIEKGDWFGSRSVDFDGTATLKEKKPVVWLPQDEIGNSPSTPLSLNVGPYKNQMIHGEVTHGGVKRVFVEEIDGVRQGCVFRFIQGLEAGVNRLRWSPDGALYAGGIGSTGNWGQNDKLWYGLQRLEFNGNSTFEMLAVRAKSNGMEVEFTQPLQMGEGWSPDDYEVRMWRYVPTIDYGGPKVDNRAMKVRSASVSDDRKKVFLEIDGLQEDHVVYILLKNKFISDQGSSLWSTETWYTMNKVPKDRNGLVTKAPDYTQTNNTLTPLEKDQGWKLLFDGKNIDQFRNFKKQSLGKSWIVDDGAIHLNAIKRDDGGWQVADGGDIITNGEYENFDLRLEWKIANCGNSGIMYNVVEEDKYDYVWLTGPEMQVLDNSCHPDTKFDTHRAGDLYDMIETKYVTVNPAGNWNKVRIVSNNGQVEFYLNGYKVVEFEMHTDEWTKMIANSKFKDMPDFGLAKKGHISLQDHGDKVWYRNIKIKEL